MQARQRLYLALAAILVLGTVLAAVIFMLAEVRVGWVGSNVDGSMAYDFLLFNGDEVAVAQVGSNDTLVVDYVANVDRGVLQITVTDPLDQVVFNEILETSGSDELIVSAPPAGSYEIRVQGQSAAGGFALDWSVQ